MIERGLKEALPRIGEILNDLWILAKLSKIYDFCGRGNKFPPA
jgi:hypothetical protein